MNIALGIAGHKMYRRGASLGAIRQNDNIDLFEAMRSAFLKRVTPWTWLQLPRSCPRRRYSRIRSVGETCTALSATVEAHFSPYPVSRKRGDNDVTFAQGRTDLGRIGYSICGIDPRVGPITCILGR
jgi:hypothetical protein